MPTRTMHTESRSRRWRLQDDNKENTTWGDIGLVEYNSKTITWETRIGDCGAQMEKTKRISHHRRKHHPEHYFGPNKQDITYPYFRKTTSALNRLLIQIELSPQEGNRNIDTSHIYNKKTPRETNGPRYCAE